MKNNAIHIKMVDKIIDFASKWRKIKQLVDDVDQEK